MILATFTLQCAPTVAGVHGLGSTVRSVAITALPQAASNGEPGDYLPSCYRCQKQTWNGQWRGVNQCKIGKGFVCRECWLAECSDEDRPQWERWFSHRENFYGRAFPANASEWKLQNCPSSLQGL